MPRVAPNLDHHANALAVRLITHISDAVDLLVARQFADLLDQISLVDLIGQLGDDDADAAALVLLGMGLGAHDDAATASRVGAADALTSLDDATGREVWPANDACSGLR